MSSIFILFRSRCPSAIYWVIIAIIVYTVYSQVIRISVINSPILKFQEIITPFIAHGYSSPPVMWKIFWIGIKASILDSFPNTVKPSFLLFMRSLRSFIGFCNNLWMKTSAAITLSAFQRKNKNIQLLPTITSATPHGISFFGVLHTPNDNKSSEALSG